jgi:hypothetical protein
LLPGLALGADDPGVGAQFVTGALEEAFHPDLELGSPGDAVMIGGCELDLAAGGFDGFRADEAELDRAGRVHDQFAQLGPAAGIEPIFQGQVEDQFAQELLVGLGQPEDLGGAELGLILAPVELAGDNDHVADAERAGQGRIVIGENENFQRAGEVLENDASPRLLVFLGGANFDLGDEAAEAGIDFLGHLFQLGDGVGLEGGEINAVFVERMAADVEAEQFLLVAEPFAGRPIGDAGRERGHVGFPGALGQGAEQIEE